MGVSLRLITHAIDIDLTPNSFRIFCSFKARKVLNNTIYKTMLGATISKCTWNCKNLYKFTISLNFY